MSCPIKHFFRHSHYVPHRRGLFSRKVLWWCFPPKKLNKPIYLPRFRLLCATMIHWWQWPLVVTSLAFPADHTMSGLWRWDLCTSLPLRWLQWRQCCCSVVATVVATIKWSGNGYNMLEHVITHDRSLLFMGYPVVMFEHLPSITVSFDDLSMSKAITEARKGAVLQLGISWHHFPPNCHHLG